MRHSVHRSQQGTCWALSRRCPSAGCQAGPAPGCARRALLCSLCALGTLQLRQVSSQQGYVSLNSTPTFPRVYKLVLLYQVVGKSYVRMKITSYRLRSKHHIHPFILKLHHVNHFAVYVTLASL